MSIKKNLFWRRNDHVYADEQQINIHFDWMDHPVTDEDSSMIYFTLTDTKTNKQGSISCGAEPEDGKLGIKISTEEDGWKIGSLYYEPAQTNTVS